MQECNPPRNSWLQTHRDDGVAGAEQKTLRLLSGEKIPSDDRFAHALKNSPSKPPRSGILVVLRVKARLYLRSNPDSSWPPPCGTWGYSTPRGRSDAPAGRLPPQWSSGP